MNQLNKTYHGDISLVSFLSPEVSLGWGISGENFSHPSWNILARALIRANLIQKHTPINVIKISDLKFLTLDDITEIKHAGKIRIQHLILELQQVKASISEEIMHENTAKEKMQDEHVEAFEHEVLSDNSSKIPIETS